MRSLVFFPLLPLTQTLIFTLLLLVTTFTFTSISLVTASIIPRSAANSSHHHDGQPRIAIFISIPLQGHLNPLIAQANELASRGWLAYLAAPQSIRSHAEKRIKDGVKWLEIGECGGDEREKEFKEISHKGTNTTDETEGLYNIFAWFCRFHECAYPGTINAIKKLPYRPSILVVDFGTTFGFAVAETLEIPMVVNNADLLSLISTDIVLASDYIPLTTSMISIHDVGLGLVPRIINPIIRFLARWYLHFNQNALLNEERAKVGLPPVNMFTWLAKNVIFVNSAFGLEYPRPIPPNVQMTGPMIDHRGDEKAEKLSAEDEAWLSADSRPVVWVSMGTLAPLHYWQVQELAKGLSNPEYRVIWKLRDEEKAFLPSTIAPTIRVTKWVSSQLGVLKHTNTKVFISHCGINSVHEAVYYMVNLLCIPMFGDQPDQGVRVVDQGVGLTASKLNFTGPEIESKLLEIIRDKTGSYRDNAVRVRSAMKLAGGVTRAADVIEDVAQFGFSAYVPLDASYPWYARNQWDVLAVYVIILWLLKKLCSSCCGFGRKCTSSRPSKQKTQ